MRCSLHNQRDYDLFIMCDLDAVPPLSRSFALSLSLSLSRSLSRSLALSLSLARPLSLARARTLALSSLTTVYPLETVASLLLLEDARPTVRKSYGFYLIPREP